MPAAIDLTTLAAFKAYSNVSSNSDTVIGTLITASSRAFMTLTNRADYINGQTVKEVRTGTGTHDIILHHVPVISVQSLVVGRAVIPAIVDGGAPSGYLLDLETGLVRLVSGIRFWRGCIVVINYTFGYAAIPEDVTQAVNEMVLYIFRKRDHIDMKTQTLAQQITSYIDAFPKTTRDIIGYYKGRSYVSSFTL